MTTYYLAYLPGPPTTYLEAEPGGDDTMEFSASIKVARRFQSQLEIELYRLARLEILSGLLGGTGTQAVTVDE